MIVPAQVIPRETLLDMLMKVMVVKSWATSWIFFIDSEAGAKVASTMKMTSSN
jgi:hypothetical protein